MHEITCPSGLRGIIREMLVRDEQTLLNKKLVRAGRALSRLIESCWHETIDYGPYDPNSFSWDKALSADRVYALIQIRSQSYGDMYEFDLTCGSCDSRYGWQVPLSELDILAVSEAGLQHVRTGEPIPITVRDETVMCRLLTGEDEAFMATIQAKDRDKILTYNLARRIVTLNGHDRFKQIVEQLENKPAVWGDELYNATDDIEGGVDVTIATECTNCGAVQSAILPFDPGFFSKKRRFARTAAGKTG